MNEQLLQWLSSKGMQVLRNAVSVKGIDWVEGIIGIKLPTSVSNVTDETIAKIKELEMQYEEQLLQVSIDDKKKSLEEMKIDVEFAKVDESNTANARDMNARIQDSKNADHLAKVAAYYLDFTIVGFTVLVSVLIFFIGVPTNNKELAYTAFGSLLTLCGTIINFHRGTSSGSKGKDDVIKSLGGK